MPDMEWSEYKENIREIMECFTYEPEKRDECRGAGGRKFNRVCIYCPNYTRWMERQKKDKERNEDNGDKRENFC